MMEHEQKFKNEIVEIKETMECMAKKVDKIHMAIVGDDTFGHTGLIKTVQKHDKWISASKFRIAYVTGAIGVIWTLLLKFWDKIFGQN